MSTKNTKRTFLQRWLQGQLRRLWLRWPQRNVAKALARVSRGKYKCVKCKEEFGPKEIEINHKEAVIDPETGFTTWDEYIKRLFVEDHRQLEVTCKPCHRAITKAQNELRKKTKK